MKKNYFGEKARKAKSSERGEAMPAAIVTAIVSSLILLGIASVVSLVVQNKADSEGDVALTTAVSNIDVSLRSDINQATYITAAAKLKQPTTRLLGPTDVNLSGVNMHIPVSSGECKVIRWNINGNNASRDLTIYQSSLKDDVSVKCNETSPVVGQRTKVFAQNVKVDAPFRFNNQVGRELAFTVDTASLDTVNTELEKQLTAKGVQKLNDTDFNELNKLMGNDSYKAGFKNPTACVMDAARIWVDANKDGVKQTTEMVCPPAEADTVAAAWNSMKVAKVGVAFQMASNSGEIAKRDIAQNSSVPLYANATEAEAAVAGSSADDRPIAETVALSTSNVTLGANYTINWTTQGVCPPDMARSFKVYENNVLVRTQSTQGYTKNYTNSATEFLNYNVQTECARGALVISSDMSAVATAKVIPAVPALVINTQPAVTNAALNSNLTSTATCLYGTTPRYNLVQAVTTYGAANTTLSNLTSVNRAINNGFTVVEGARYQYRVEAWCISPFDKSANTSTTTNPFVTLVSAPPTAPPVVSPTNGATNVATNAVVDWSTVPCAVGTTVKYFSAKTTNAGASITQQVIDNWTGNTSLVSNNTQGNTVGYTIMARCEGTVATSTPSPSANVLYTTLINVPSTAPVFTAPADNAGNIVTNASVTWSSVTCAPSTNVEYYVTKNVDKGAAITPVVLINWASDTSLVSNNSQGNTVGYSVAARCAGPNANSSATAADTVRFTTRVIAPSAPTFTSPANGATGVAINAPVNWSAVTCTNGAVPQYYTTKNINTGAAMATPTVIDNWTGDISLVSNNTEGNTVGYTVMARCAGPNADSANSAASTVSYTTVINAPAQVQFIAPTPVDGSMYQSVSANLTWNAGVCATGTTAKYFAFKDMNAGAAISPINIYNWATNTSYTTNAAQGSTVRYVVTGRCDGPNAISAETPKDYVRYTTKVEAPSGPWTWNDGWGTVSWNAPGTNCGGGASIQYRIHQVLADGGPMDAWGGWGTGQASGLPSYNTGGYPQGAEIQARCVGPNDTSAGAMGNTTKWVKNFDVSFSAWQQWRRVNVAANCPFGTSVAYYNLYVAADGWWGARGTVGGIQTDEGATIASAAAGGGGNTGWINMAQNVNGQWNAATQWGTTYNWGYWGNSGWGSSFNNAYSGPSLSGTYWNASGWGNWVYYAYGVCTTPYMHVYAKNAQWIGGGIRNAGTPWTQYDAQPQGRYYTQAGTDATR